MSIFGNIAARICGKTYKVSQPTAQRTAAAASTTTTSRRSQPWTHQSTAEPTPLHRHHPGRRPPQTYEEAQQAYHPHWNLLPDRDESERSFEPRLYSVPSSRPANVLTLADSSSNSNSISNSNGNTGTDHCLDLTHGVDRSLYPQRFAASQPGTLPTLLESRFSDEEPSRPAPARQQPASRQPHDGGRSYQFGPRAARPPENVAVPPRRAPNLPLVPRVMHLVQRIETQPSDLAARQAWNRFHNDVTIASEIYGKKVAFRPLHHQGKPFGYLLTCSDEAANACRFPRRALLVAGSGQRCPDPAYLHSKSSVVRMDRPGGKTGACDIARVARSTGVNQDQIISRHDPEARAPNRMLDNAGISPTEGAKLVWETDREHTKPVDVFVAAPGIPVSMAMLEQSLPAGLYGTILYVQPSPQLPVQGEGSEFRMVSDIAVRF